MSSDRKRSPIELSSVSLTLNDAHTPETHGCVRPSIGQTKLGREHSPKVLVSLDDSRPASLLGVESESQESENRGKTYVLRTEIPGLFASEVVRVPSPIGSWSEACFCGKWGWH